MIKKLSFVIILVSISTLLFAIDMDKIVAYPVPFNPKKTVLKIDNPSSPGASTHTIHVEIFDINGDLVTRKNSSSLPVLWNGRNNSGRHVKPGMYIIKVEAEDSTTGDYGKKNIRILVNY